MSKKKATKKTAKKAPAKHSPVKKKSVRKKVAKKVTKSRTSKPIASKPKKTMGRPKVTINWKMVNEMAKLQCTGEEVASVLGCSIDSLERRCKEDNKDADGEPITLAVYLKQKGAGGRASLRRLQYKAAEKGNPAMLIWLGKQYLDQSDKQDMKIKGTIGITIADDEEGL